MTHLHFFSFRTHNPYMFVSNGVYTSTMDNLFTTWNDNIDFPDESLRDQSILTAITFERYYIERTSDEI